MVNCLVPSGIFPAVFEELRSKCCFEGLSSEPIYNHAEFAGSQGAVDSAQHPPSSSALSQKRFFKGLKVHSGAKETLRKKEGSYSWVRVKCSFLLTVDVTPVGTK